MGLGGLSGPKPPTRDLLPGLPDLLPGTNSAARWSAFLASRRAATKEQTRILCPLSRHVSWAASLMGRGLAMFSAAGRFRIWAIGERNTAPSSGVLAHPTVPVRSAPFVSVAQEKPSPAMHKSGTLQRASAASVFFQQGPTLTEEGGARGL